MAASEENIFHHVMDSNKWEFFPVLTGKGGVPLPSIPLPFGLPPFQITKFMLMEVIAAAMIVAIYVPLARRIASGATIKGPFWNAFEGLLTFIRDSVARPSLTPPEDGHGEEGHGHGEHHGAAHAPRDPDAEVDKFVPYLWTVFLFILFCNLLGMIPFLGSPTANPVVTGVLATCSFLLFHGAATKKMGFLGYMKSIWPPMELPLVMAIFIKPMIFVIELFGTVIKSFVLAVRLFANMFAGHMVLSVILGFIIVTNTIAVGLIGWGGITTASILGVVALSLLEIFVAFLQAFIFTFLTALFLGMAINPQH
jgi:F-type H+-transporting ATPase subunit a